MKDAIWNWFVFWGALIQGVLSIGLAALGTYLAWRAIRMGEEQAATSKRQADIAERQDAILQNQLQRRASPVMEIDVGMPFGSGGSIHDIIIRNDGNGTLRDFYWEVFVPYPLTLHTELNLGNGNNYEEVLALDAHSGLYGMQSGHCEKPVFGGRRMTLGRLHVMKDFAEDKYFLRWRITSEDGVHPGVNELGETFTAFY